MNIVKWLTLLVLLFPLTGCATLSQSNFDNVFEKNPNISPDELPGSLKQKPIEDTLINSSFRYQVYDLGLWGMKGHKAVYFKDGQMIAQEPYTDKFSNLNTLLNLGAVTQQQHDDPCGTHVPGFVDAGCGCGMPGPSGCDNQCGSTKSTDACGVCGGDVISCTPPLSCTGIDSCGCVGMTDCAGTCGGSATTDACGQCGGNGSECAPSST